MGNLFSEAGKSLTLGACDTFRAAATEQLKSWANRLDLEIVSGHHGGDAAAVAFDAYSSALAKERDYLLLDTAGRLHVKDHLMEELAKLRRVLQNRDPESPHHSWLVVDGSTGTNGLSQAKLFHEKFGLTGLVVTKLDGTAKGGVVIGISDQFKIPVKYIGVGEKIDDLIIFDKHEFVDSLFKGVTNS